MLQYKSHICKTQKFWEVIQYDRDFRKSLVRQCFNTFTVLQDGFGYFDCNHQEILEMVLNG
jgi:hypothetical protein